MENFQTFSREVFEILINEMEMLNIEVAIPLISENQFVGLLGFGRKRLRGVYDMEDVSALKLLSGRAADAILNFETVDKLRERETLALIGEMTAGIAHEIKNPLGAIKGAADNLTGTSFPKDIRKFSTIITEESSRLDRIVKQFLIYARPAEASIEEADLVRLTQRCRELFLSESKADAFSVRVTGTEDSIMALVDPDFFKQVFYNIAGNSFEAKQDGTIQLSVTQNHGQAEVKFSDNCGGMVRDIADKVFNPFFTTKHEGTGLGMAIVKKLVRLMNGNIYINTRLKQGTDIILVFPQKAEARRGA
jgi:signal transduction histidine kinase